jgi:hypothetical protein
MTWLVQALPWFETYLAYRPWAQIPNHGRPCTQALLLYFKNHVSFFIWSPHSEECSPGMGWVQLVE